ncbi:MAG: hypothetical protein ACREQ9_26480, partial [Candidatus Binatia bacterium]
MLAAIAPSHCTSMSASSWPPPVSYEPLYLSGPALPGVPGRLVVSAPAEPQDPDLLLQQMPSGPCS